MRQIGGAGVTGGWGTLAFFAPVALASLPIVLRRGRAMSRRAHILLPAGVMVGGAFALYATAILLTDVIRVILLFYLTPIWGTLLSRVVHGRAITWPRALALMLGLAGLVVILGAGEGSPLPLPRNSGDWMALASGMLWAGGTLILHHGADDEPIDIVVSFCWFGAVTSLLLLLLPVSGNESLPTTSQLTAALPWIALLAVVFTLPTMYAIFWAARFMDPGRIGLLLLSEVVVAVITAAIWSGEPFGVREALGAGLIVGAGVVDVLGQRRRTGPG